MLQPLDGAERWGKYTEMPNWWLLDSLIHDQLVWLIEHSLPRSLQCKGTQRRCFLNTIRSCTNNYKTTLKHLQLHSIIWHASKIKNIHIVFWTSAAKIQQETVLFYFSFHSEFSQEKCQLVTMILSVSSGNMMWIWAEGACNQTSACIYEWGLLLRISWTYITGHWATERQRQREEIHICEEKLTFTWPAHGWQNSNEYRWEPCQVNSKAKCIPAAPLYLLCTAAGRLLLGYIQFFKVIWYWLNYHACGGWNQDCCEKLRKSGLDSDWQPESRAVASFSIEQ